MADEYPRWLYAKDGRAQIVRDEDEEAALGSDFSREPSDIHRGPAAGVPEMPLPHGQEGLINDIATRVADLVVERLMAVQPAPDDGAAPQPQAPSTEPAPRERKRT
jgi:hypothetical protein